MNTPIPNPPGILAWTGLRPLWSVASLLGVAILPWIGPTSATAQQVPSLGSEGVVAGELRLGTSISAVRGSGMPFIRGTALLHIAPWLSIGGEAAIPLREVPTTSATSPDRSELLLRYGGLRVAAQRPGFEGSDPWAISLLLGTGTARVRSSLLDTELGVDNFFVLEPALERAITPLGPFDVRAAAAYRIPLGAHSLPGVRPSQLRGASVTISFGLRKDP